MVMRGGLFFGCLPAGSQICCDIQVQFRMIGGTGCPRLDQGYLLTPGDHIQFRLLLTPSVHGLFRMVVF